MKLDLMVLMHQLARSVAYLWAVTLPDAYRTTLYITPENYSEDERFVMPNGKVVRVTIEYVNEEEISESL